VVDRPADPRQALWRNLPFELKAAGDLKTTSAIFVWATLGVHYRRPPYSFSGGTFLRSFRLPEGAFCGGPANHLPGDFLVHPLRIISA
jgi:hypothetical protein